MLYSRVTRLPPTVGGLQRAALCPVVSLLPQGTPKEFNSTRTRASYFGPKDRYTARLRSSQIRVLRDMRSETSTTREYKEDSQISTKTLEGKQTSHKAAAGTLFGAIALITGSTVGAGMLALPEVTAPAGFGPTAAGLIATWALLVAEALLMAEVNLELMSQAKPEDEGKIVTLRKMAEDTLGKPGRLVTIIYLLLSYCLLVAYLAKASEVLDYFAGHTLAPITSASLLCTFIGGLFLIGGPNAADRLNQALASVLFAFFLAILGVGVTQNDVVGNLATNPASWSNLSPAVPILFLSLVYHDLVPLICSYLGGDRKLVRSALVLGSLVPLFMFLSWEAVALSLVPGGGLVLSGGDFTSAAVAVQEVALTASSSISTAVSTAMTTATTTIKPLTVDPLQVFVHRSGPGVGLLVECFSFLAVITSFMGTVYGLSETLRSEVPSMIRDVGTFLGSDDMALYDLDNSTTSSTTEIEDTTPIEQQVSINASSITTVAATTEQQPEELEQQGFLSDPSRMLALALTLGPPLAFTANNPGAFLAVLSIAGGYGMTALYGVMPPLMAYKLRERSSSSDESAAYKPMMPGGMPALAGTFAAAAIAGFSRITADADEAIEALSRIANGLMSAEEAEMFVSSVEMAAAALATVASSANIYLAQ